LLIVILTKEMNNLVFTKKMNVLVFLSVEISRISAMPLLWWYKPCRNDRTILP